MRTISIVAILIGVINIVVGIISRLTLTPIVRLESRAFAGFAGLCFLLAIALSVLEKKPEKNREFI